MSVYIPMEMPTSCYVCPFCDYVSARCDAVKGNPYTPASRYEKIADFCPLVPVPEHEQILRVLKTERECVSRDCDRDCQKCDLSLEREAIVGVYDALIATLDPTDKEGDG